MANIASITEKLYHCGVQEIDLVKENLNERLSNDTKKLLDLAMRAGAVALESRNKGLAINDIHLSGFVTSGDIDVDDFVHSLAKSEFPQAVILSEETHFAFSFKEGQEVLIVDPIDGTRWYKDGGDFWSINLSLVKNGELKSAVIVQPDMGVLTFAEKGLGAFCQKDGRLVQIRTNPETDLLKCKVGVGARMADPQTRSQIAELIKEITFQSRGPYVLESSGYELALIARGVAMSAYIHPHAPAWDKTAGMLLVREAGGVATGWPGRDEIFGNGVLVASNPGIYNKIADLAIRYVR
jgi:myo-inositol-1(or 4)-monophosphatase